MSQKVGAQRDQRVAAKPPAASSRRASVHQAPGVPVGTCTGGSGVPVTVTWKQQVPFATGPEALKQLVVVPIGKPDPVGKPAVCTGAAEQPADAIGAA